MNGIQQVYEKSITKGRGMNMRKPGLLKTVFIGMLLCILLTVIPFAAWMEEDIVTRIDFLNGNIGFLVLDASPVDASPDTTMELVDYNGGKAVKISPDGSAAPYVIIDASSLLTEAITDLVTMRVSIATEHHSGTFYAVSGDIIVYSGVDRAESKSPWSVYLATKNPNNAIVALNTPAKRFVPDAYNYFVISKKDDNGLNAKEGPVALYLLSIEFFDENDQLLPVNAEAVFNPPEGFGEKGESSLYTLLNETTIDGAVGSTPGGWGQAVSMETVRAGGIIEPGWFTPGFVISVAYESESSPEIIFQSWTDGKPDSAGWAKVAPRLEEKGIAQFFYDDIVNAFGTDDFESFLDKFNVGDTGNAITVLKVSYGQGYPPPVMILDETEVEGASGSSAGGWGQAVAMDTIRGSGIFDPGILKPGSVLTVLYESAGIPEIILQSWTDGKPDSAGWAKVAPFALGSGIAQFAYDDIITSFGTDDFDSYLDKFYIGDTGEALNVIKAYVGIPIPPLVSVNDEFEIEGATGTSSGGWGQAVALESVKNDGVVQADWFTAGSVITVLYESDNVPELIFQSWTDGNPVGWAKIAPFTTRAGIAQFVYDDIVAAFGTDDFITFLDKLYIGDTGAALTVYKVAIGYTGEKPITTSISQEETNAEESEAISETVPLKPIVDVTDEFVIEGAGGVSSGGWGQAVSMETTRSGGIIEPGWFVPGSIITVTYDSASAPELVFQSWTDGAPVGWAKVAPFAGGDNVAQYDYATIVESFGTDDFTTFFDKFYIGDTGEPLTVEKVTIGTESPFVTEEENPPQPPVALVDYFNIEGATGSSGGSWGQAVSLETTRSGGIIEPGWFVPGIIVHVNYTSDSPPEVVLQSWTDGAPVSWAKVTPFAWDEDNAQFSYEDMIIAFGTEDLISFFDKFYVGDTGATLEVFGVSIGNAD